MKLMMTAMVRDEVDIIGAMLDYHLRAGVDQILVTDNGSVDGTREILSDFERAGGVVVFDDPVQNKQQFRVVTRMARVAYETFGADWVLNSDADEFWFPADPTSTLKDQLSAIPDNFFSVHVDVYNMTGLPARRGTGLDRLIWRDVRDEEALRAAGLFAHPTHNCAHRGSSTVEVAQGNHWASEPGGVALDDTSGMVVLHFPWRSFEQISNKVRISGEAYDRNPTLNPSPRHHGMADYRRLKEGRFEYSYVMRHPVGLLDGAGRAGTGFELDRRLLDAVSVDQLVARSLVVPDATYSHDDLAEFRRVGLLLEPLERASLFDNADLKSELRLVHRDAQRALARVKELEAENAANILAAKELSAERERLAVELSSVERRLKVAENRKSVRWANAAGRAVRRLRRSGLGSVNAVRAGTSGSNGSRSGGSL